MLKSIFLSNIIYLRNKSWKPECVLRFKWKFRKQYIFLYVFPDVCIWLFICILAFYYAG